MTSDVWLTLAIQISRLLSSNVKVMHRTMISNKSSIYYTALIFVINCALIKSDEALLFDLEENVLVEKDLLRGATETRCHKCVVTCPANPSEKDSVGDRALVVQKLYEKFDKIVLPLCDGSIRPSFMINRETRLLEIGYEIYDLNNILDPSELKINRNRFLSLYPSNVNTIANPRLVLVGYFNSVPGTSSSEESIEVNHSQGFIWIPVLFIDLNFETMSPKAIQYNPGFGNHWPRENCDTFEEGKEIYKDPNAYFRPYSYENQRMILTGEKYAPGSFPTRESDCGQKYGCLVMHQIIPSYYMHSYFGEFATCVVVNTVPIWEIIEKQMKIVNLYLYAMSQIWKSNIRFKTGFFEILKPSKKHFTKIPIDNHELYLNQANKEVPVPMIVYKIVELSVNMPHPWDLTDYYYAVIVIHNDPTPDAGKQRICEKKSTRNNGWEDIANEKSQSGLTYVCPFSKEVAEKLNLVRDAKMMDDEYLKPNHFPVYNITQGTVVYQDKKLEIKQKIKELF